MAATVAGLFPDRRSAESGLVALEAAGFPRSRVRLLTGEHAMAQPSQKEQAGRSIVGAIVGSLIIGSLGAVIAWAASLFFRNTGASITYSVIALALIGGMIGWFVGALWFKGAPIEEAEYYREYMQQGRTILAIDAQGRDPLARQILAAQGAQDIRVAPRAGGWRRARSHTASVEPHGPRSGSALT